MLKFGVAALGAGPWLLTIKTMGILMEINHNNNNRNEMEKYKHTWMKYENYTYWLARIEVGSIL